MFALVAGLVLGQPLPPAAPGDRVHPLTLAAALRLAGANTLDVQIAGRQVEIAARLLDRAKLLWVPNVTVGTDSFRHTGLQQNFAGDILGSNRGTFMAGVGPNLVLPTADAVFAPLAARQELRARKATLQAVTNDVTLAVVVAYFDVQQARGELAGATLATAKADEVSRRAEGLAAGLAPPLEATRARVELSRCRQAEATARERWRTASAELVRLLRLDPTTLVEPAEPPFLTVTVIDPACPLAELIPLALANRPELVGQSALVQAAVARLRAERNRPLLPTVAFRSVSTNPSGSLGWGAFGGGPNYRLGNFAGRSDFDLQLLWEFQNLGLGNRARAGEQQAAHAVATLELLRTQDRVAAEVATAFAQATAAAERLKLAEPTLKDAVELVDKSLEGLKTTRRAGDLLTLVVRPQEVVAAVQALGQANADYHAAVGDFNRSQFRLYRALGHPPAALPAVVPDGPAK